MVQYEVNFKDIRKVVECDRSMCKHKIWHKFKVFNGAMYVRLYTENDYNKAKEMVLHFADIAD